MSRNFQYDVAVIGLGPVGAIAANLLAREGLSVVAVDLSTQPYDKPRAVGLDHESLLVLQQIGVAELLEPFMSSYRASEYHSATGEVLRRIIPQPEPNPLSWPTYVTFLQPELERLLRSSFNQWPNLRTEFGVRCTDLIADGHGQKVQLQSVNTEEQRLIECRYVLACDGASSPIRGMLGIDLEDLAFDEPWLVVDVHVADDVALPLTNVQYCDPRRPCTYVFGPGTLRRWEIMLLPGEDPAEMAQPHMLWSLLSRWLTPSQGRIWRAATYRFHALVADCWHKDDIFLAGDAAHQTPPFMAQGLNQGIRDVANLCWKIADVVQHRATPDLLASYEVERRPNARTVIELTKKLGRIICERDPVVVAERDRHMLNEMETGTGVVVRQDLLPALTDGFLLRDEQGELVPAAGTVFPQPWLKTPTGLVRMDDVVRGRYLLVSRATCPNETAVVQLAQELAVTLIDLAPSVENGAHMLIDEADSVLSDWFAKHNVDVALVRPDHITFGTGRGEGSAYSLLHSLKEYLYHAPVAVAHSYVKKKSNFPR